MSWSAKLKTPTKPTGTLSKASRQVTPGNKALQDENLKPLSSKTETSRSLKQKGVACNILNKRLKDETSSSSESLLSGTPRTPLTSTNRNPRTPAGKKTPTSRVAGGAKPGTPKSNQRTPTKNTPTRRERSEPGRSVLVEFSDDIFVTPGHLITADPGTPTSVSVKTSSTISFHNGPLTPHRVLSPHSSLNRSLSASSLSHRSSDGANPLLRSQSEAKLSGFVGAAVTLPQCNNGETSRVTVGIRVRPLHHKESGNTVFITGNEIRVASDLGSVHRFNYDHCFSSTDPEPSSQEYVYDTLVRPLVDTAFQGYNACLFAYGQTGSGKTYSMMGPMHANTGLTAESGIIPRFCREVLERTSALDNTAGDQAQSSVTTTVEISYLEVYNEKIHDLLAPGTEQLRVREHPVYGPYVVELSKHTTSTYNELQHWIDIGNQKRATAATEMNDKSSRSHSLFTVILTQTFAQVGSDGSWNHDQTRRSQINLVDLAGSERIAHSSVSSDRLREGVSINKSLLTLGKVMSALIEKRAHVPYRDSVLTWLLKESLGGNSRTTMLATISPSSAHIDETLSTLRYASQARSIINTVRVNEAPQDKLIRELRAEIERLRGMGPVIEGISRPFEPKEKKDASEAQVKHLNDQLQEKCRDLKETKLQCAALKSEREKLESKLNEYIENNRQLASEIASEKNVKESAVTTKEGEMKVIIDELVSLRDQHKNLKKHYLQSQDELELERGAKYQILSEKEKDAGEIAMLKAQVSSLERDLLMERNESALKDSDLKKLKSEMQEIQLAQDNLTTTFLLKEEFCNAQAEKEELLIEKKKEISELQNKIDALMANCKNVSDILGGMSFLKRSSVSGSVGDVGNLGPSMKKVKEHMDFLETTNRLLKQQLEKGAEDRSAKDGEIAVLKEQMKNMTPAEKPQPVAEWQSKYDEIHREFEDLRMEKSQLAVEVASLLLEVESTKKLKEETDQLHDKLKKELEELKKNAKRSEENLEELNNLKCELKATKKQVSKANEKASEWKRTYEKCSTLNNDLGKSKAVILEEKNKMASNIKSLEAELEKLKKQLEDVAIHKSNSESWKHKYEEIQESAAKIVGLQKENEELSSKMKGLEKELKSCKDELEEKTNTCKMHLEKLEGLRKKHRLEVEEQNKVVTSLKQDNQSLQDGLHLCKEEKAKLDDLSNELKVRIDNLESEKATSSAKYIMEVDALRKELVSLQNEVKKVGELEKDLLDLRTENEKLKKANDEMKSKIQSMSNTPDASNAAEVAKLKAEVQGLTERNQYMKRKIRKSKLFGNSDDSRKLKTEITQLKRVNKDVASELEKVRGLNITVGGDGDACLKVELKSVRAELERVESMKANIDNLLQTAKQELESASSEMKILRSENCTLEKRASKAVIENESLREQAAKLEKEKIDLQDRLNHISGEKSVTDYKLRMSLASTKSIEDKEVELKRIQEKCDELREESAELKKSLAALEHQVGISKLNEDTLKSDLLAKSTQIDQLQNEIKASQKMQRELMEEKLALVKVMEKHFDDSSLEDRKGILAENAVLKKELRLCQQRLDNKCEKSTALYKRVSELENILVKVIDDKIKGQLQLEDLRNALANKDYNALDMVMGLYLPHHLEYLVRRARALTENYKIPYDIDLLHEERQILFRHLILKAVVVLNRTLLDKWIEKVEEQKGWSKADDKALPWKVDFDSYISNTDTKADCGAESPPEADANESSALTTGIKKKSDGTLDPVEWRRALIQRHVRGMKDDYRVLIKYFGAEDDSAIYAILERIRTSVDRLEQVTASIAH